MLTSRTRRGLRATLMLSCLTASAVPVLGAEQAPPTAGPPPIELILSNLPPPGSPGHSALEQAAGGTASQTLDMTHSEKWTIAADHFAALSAEAGRQGVDITRLDASWNETLKPAPSGQAMTAKQDQMMIDAMASKAAMGVHMMALPDAKVLEYALTKDMNSDAAAAAAPEIVFPLDATASVKIKRTSVEKQNDKYVWHGVIEETGEMATLLWWPAGRLAGTITYHGHMYAIRNMGGTMHGIVDMAPKMLPPEHAPMDQKIKQKMKMEEDPLVKNGDAGRLREEMKNAKSPRPHDTSPERGRTKNLEDASPKAVPVDTAKLALVVPKTSPSSAMPGPVTITMMVAYTKRAAQHYTDITKDLIDVAIEDVNQSFRNSGVRNVKVELVHTYQTGYAEKGTHFDHVFKFADKGDGVMEEVHALRDKYRADVSILVVDDNNGCGLAAGVAPKEERAFAVVHHECAALSYSIGHELGHIIGARHDLGLDDTQQPFAYGHGFVYGTSWRTMMSYEESCGGCPRLPIWSNPEVMIRGVPAGDAQSNNARVIAEGAARVAKFR